MEAIILFLVTSVGAGALVIYLYNTLTRRLVLWLFSPLLKKIQRRKIEELIEEHEHHETDHDAAA